MRVVQCPDTYDAFGQCIRIFLAGGISGCPDWQSQAIDLYRKELADKPELDQRIILLNPRRADFDINDKNMSTHQIEWEYDQLQMSDHKIFWFPFETLCPITLFELARHEESDITVGCHPDYKRAFDVDKQLNLRASDMGHSPVTIYNKLEDVVSNSIKHILANTPLYD